MNPENSDGIRDLARDVEQDGLVQRISDFRDVRYFAIDVVGIARTT